LITATENISSGRIDVYPNPATDELRISTSSIVDGTIAVYNVLGEKMLEEKLNISGRTILNIKMLTSGVYFINVTDGERSFVGKFVKE